LEFQARAMSRKVIAWHHLRCVLGREVAKLPRESRQPHSRVLKFKPHRNYETHAMFLPSAGLEGMRVGSSEWLSHLALRKGWGEPLGSSNPHKNRALRISEPDRITNLLKGVVTRFDFFVAKEVTPVEKKTSRCLVTVVGSRSGLGPMSLSPGCPLSRVLQCETNQRKMFKREPG
jgi:hypothetical protein